MEILRGYYENRDEEVAKSANTIFTVYVHQEKSIRGNEDVVVFGKLNIVSVSGFFSFFFDS